MLPTTSERCQFVVEKEGRVCVEYIPYDSDYQWQKFYESHRGNYFQFFLVRSCTLCYNLSLYYPVTTALSY